MGGDPAIPPRRHDCFVHQACNPWRFRETQALSGPIYPEVVPPLAAFRETFASSREDPPNMTPRRNSSKVFSLATKVLLTVRCFPRSGARFVPVFGPVYKTGEGVRASNPLTRSYPPLLPQDYCGGDEVMDYFQIYEFLFVGSFSMLGVALMMRRERRRKKAIELRSMVRHLSQACK
jgi:hypothetical protein